MISKLPRWVLVGGAVLAFVAGMVNVICLTSFEHLPVSHLTATTSRLGESAAEGDHRTLLKMAGVIAAFFVGAVACGWMIRSSALELGRRYGTALLVESVALCVAAYFLQHGHAAGIGLCAFACGLQNGIASNFSGAIVRTTHMTGLFTDLGVHTGQILRGYPADWRRIRLYGSIITGFITGGFAAALLVPVMSNAALLVPAGLVAAIALDYQFRWNRFTTAQ